MREWSSVEARDKPEQVLDLCEEEEPQIICMDDEPVAVLVTLQEWQALKQAGGEGAEE